MQELKSLQDIQMIKRLLVSNAQLRMKDSLALKLQPYVTYRYLFDETDDQLVFDENGDILTSSLYKLVEKATEDIVYLRDVLILTAPLYCNSQTLLRLLKIRAAIPNPILAAPSEVKEFQQKKKDLVTAKVSAVLRS